MGQRSQMYVRYESADGKYKNMVAQYFQWNYGTGMISRTRGLLEYLNSRIEYPFVFDYKAYDSRLIADYMNTDFNTWDIYPSWSIFDEYAKGGYDYSLNELLFGIDNNDGRLLVDVKGTTIKYCFLDWSNNTDNIMNAEQYMAWDTGAADEGRTWEEHVEEYDGKQAVRTCHGNIKAINKLAKLMTKEEVEDFLNGDYTYILNK
jgi:hypothetical protein